MSMKLEGTKNMSPKQCSFPEPNKPGAVSKMDLIKAKAPVIVMPMVIIAIVYCVDNVPHV